MQKIPNGFTKKYGGDMSNPMNLKPPDGTEWKMYWTKHDSDIWFQNGWKEFATNYSLDHGHMVLFEYKDSSHFEVHIFDKSTLEIQYPFQFHGSQENLDKISDDSVEILDELPPSSCKKTKLKSPMSSPQPSKKLKTGTSGKVERSPKFQNMGKHVKIKGSQSQGTNFENSTFASDKEELDSDGVNCIDPGRIPDNEGEMATQQSALHPFINGALKEASKFTSENPFFIVYVKPDQGHYYRPYVPNAFITKYFNKRKRIVMLQFGKKLWPIKLLYYPHGAKLSGGWSLFARESKLLGGDACLFELINREDYMLDVHIFRDN
ncbi:DNA-binding barrel domain superfamily [Sesbania bispinosa]|nr:DNA-binding barrel domain superfamily [Sesbania bispinosa]